MKILKPGKAEQRKFVCQKCGCVFVATLGDTEWWGLQVLNCPCGVELSWDSGEPYEEPTPTQTDRERLELIRLIKNFRACGLETADCEADFLIANGVTFREGVSSWDINTE